MGWKADPVVKREAVLGASQVLTEGRDSAELHKYVYIVVDLNAWFRDLGLDDTVVPPVVAVRRNLWGSYPFGKTCRCHTVPYRAGWLHRFLPKIHRIGCRCRAKAVIFTPDDYDKHHESRHAFYAREREKEADRPPRYDEYLCPVTNRLYKHKNRPLDDADVDKIAADTMPATWARVWNNKRAKIKAWDVRRRRAHGGPNVLCVYGGVATGYRAVHQGHCYRRGPGGPRHRVHYP